MISLRKRVINNGPVTRALTSAYPQEGEEHSDRKKKKKQRIGVLEIVKLYPKKVILGIILLWLLKNSVSIINRMLHERNQRLRLLKAKENKTTPSYIICNGLSNQFLAHAAHISNAITLKEDINIPDVFIFNGVQVRTPMDTLPNEANSFPLHRIIDPVPLIDYVESKGIKVQVLPYRDVVPLDYDEEGKGDETLSCDWQESLAKADNQVVQEVLNILNPSKYLSDLIHLNLSNLLKKSSRSTEEAKFSDGICLHHRDGPDWHDHCKIWEAINDGVWRKNCLNDRDLSLLDLVKERIPEKAPKSWIYYIGDKEPSDVMVESFRAEGLDIFHRSKDNLLNVQDIADAFKLDAKDISLDWHRDLFTAIDFFTCSEIDSFIGNSVSTFSSNQIARRNAINSSWYNSRSIPVSNTFQVYQFPFVYTYTEESKAMSKALLKASILSVRGSFGKNGHIHILYHGENDIQFLNWLKTNDVVIHKHDPTWLETIETMRQHGNPERSHLFLDKGNYIGTWQRIDIPLFIDAEYCLLLDSDTVIHSKFGMHDFGLALTPALLVSSEGDEVVKRPWNLGVVLMNVPRLRETHADFMKFIEAHIENPEFKDGNISDQGAYLEFYESTTHFLGFMFNVKPYWDEKKHFKQAKITHFHGLKPHDILKLWMDFPIESFPQAVHTLIPKVMPEASWFFFYARRKERHVCQTMHDFSLYIVKDSSNLKEYCDLAFVDDATSEQEQENNKSICSKFFKSLASVKGGKYATCKRSILRPLLPKRGIFSGIFGG